MAASQIEMYKKEMFNTFRMYLPRTLTDREVNDAIDYSIKKRLTNHPVTITNTYTHKKVNSTILDLCNYILNRQPIVTAAGTMFKKHAEVPNPLATVVEQFLTARSIYKDKMYTFPKGSEDYQKYNLLQLLEKINANAMYGCLGAFKCILFNVNIATSVTAQGRALISTATLFLESFLANNVQFGSVDEVLNFILRIKEEKRKFKDSDLLDHNINPATCFAKVVTSCGYRWIPDDEELDIIWRVINNLSQEDLNRVYYKNNLYEFMSNSRMKQMIEDIICTMSTPLLNSLDPEDVIVPMLDNLTDILEEYVYYGYMYMDRIDRTDNMIKKTIAVSDTDSVIVSLDAWYQFCNKFLKDIPMKIKQFNPIKITYFMKKDEFGDYVNLNDISPIYFEEKDYDYDFSNDEILEIKKSINPLIWYSEDNYRWSIINIMSYVIGNLMNKYVGKIAVNNNSSGHEGKCRLYLKNEFSFLRLAMTTAKKQYASLISVQEGHIIPEEEQLDVKGIDALMKSTSSIATRNRLQKIMVEDILRAPAIDQLKLIKDLAIFEREIINDIKSGSKKYYKPLVVKSASNYANPMRVSGIRASIVWNSLKTSDLPGLDTNERNSVDIAKVILTKKTVDKLKAYPEVYENACKLLENPIFKGVIKAVAIPLNMKVPDWLLEIVDYDLLASNNVSGFPYDSVGIVKVNNNSNYSNILTL